MHVAFFGLREAFDYFHISGFQSIVRRLSLDMISKGIKVDYVMYRAAESREVYPKENLKLRYFVTFEEAFNTLCLSSYDHIIHVRVTSYWDRFKVIFFRKRLPVDTQYHYFSLGWPDSFIKRILRFAEALLVSRKGRIICISPRLYRAHKKWMKNVDFLLPPVPEDYFLKPGEKPKNEKIKITFLGVIYPDKGIEDVIEIFKDLKNDSRFDTAIYAIYEPKNEWSVRLRNWLKIQNEIKYIEIDRYKYNDQTEAMVRNVLRDTDIFIQPYTSLGATVDTPLLILEAMASLCAIITTPIGSIPEIYGENDFLMDYDRDASRVICFLQKISYNDIEIERKRVFEQCKKLSFEAHLVAKRFIEILGNN